MSTDILVVGICIATMPFYFLGRRAYWALKRRLRRA